LGQYSQGLLKSSVLSRKIPRKANFAPLLLQTHGIQVKDDLRRIHVTIRFVAQR
jgi:hypothetical protein